MPAILGYGCSSSAGRGVDSFWTSLVSGRVSERIALSEPRITASFWSDGEAAEKSSLSSLELLAGELLVSWREALSRMTTADRVAFDESASQDRVGVILATTKGCIDDFIWKKGANAELACDPQTPVLEAFLKQADLSATHSICVSNACASSLSALFLARFWLKSRRVTHVVVLAADRVGPFVLKGFHSLKALSLRGTEPFSAERDGLRLGEAACAIVLAEALEAGAGEGLTLSGVGVDAEGHAVTRAAETGESLKRACLQITGLREKAPELVIAHGTGTRINDAVEDSVFSALFEKAETRVRITGTKWCIGHSLGASGAMDVIAACEVLSRQRAFGLRTTRAIDPSFRSSYLLLDENEPFQAENVLVTSLGFGGIHAAALISMRSKAPS